METSKLTVKEKIGYGMGDAGCNIIFGAIMLFVNYFYTDIFASVHTKRLRKGFQRILAAMMVMHIGIMQFLTWRIKLSDAMKIINC